VKSTIFGSPHIAEVVAKELANQHAAALMEFLNNSSHFGHLGPLRGHLFEAVSHLLLMKGGKFSVKRLGDDSSQCDMQVQGANLRLFDNIADVKPDVCCYARPIQKNYPSIDSLKTPNTLFTITIGDTHDFKPAGPQRIHSHLKQKEYNLFIVVPDDVFPKWVRRNEELKYDPLMVQGCRWPFKIAAQYVLSIPLRNLAVLTRDAPVLHSDIMPPAKKPKLSGNKTVWCRCPKGNCCTPPCKCKKSEELCNQQGSDKDNFCQCSSNCMNNNLEL
jgi:hypothetical protein